MPSRVGALTGLPPSGLAPGRLDGPHLVLRLGVGVDGAGGGGAGGGRGQGTAAAPSPSRGPVVRLVLRQRGAARDRVSAAPEHLQHRHTRQLQDGDDTTGH